MNVYHHYIQSSKILRFLAAVVCCSLQVLCHIDMPQTFDNSVPHRSMAGTPAMSGDHK